MGISAGTIIATICPELSGSPSLQVYLEMAVERTDRRFFGALYNQAVAYRACHLFTIYGDSQGGGGAGNPAAGMGPVAGMGEGGLSVSYAVTAAAANSDTLSTTKYGKMLLELMKGRPRMGVSFGGVR